MVCRCTRLGRGCKVVPTPIQRPGLSDSLHWRVVGWQGWASIRKFHKAEYSHRDLCQGLLCTGEELTSRKHQCQQQDKPPQLVPYSRSQKAHWTLHSDSAAQLVLGTVIMAGMRAIPLSVYKFTKAKGYGKVLPGFLLLMQITENYHLDFSVIFC